jgi:hypothetical protein
MTDSEIIDAEAAAHKKARNCGVYYKGTSVRAATESGIRSAACSDEWMRLRNELIKRGLAPKTAP